jgi:nitrite reductase (cytochrome c-552)
MVNASCQTCHKAAEDELLSRVRVIQDKTFGMRNRAMDAVVALIGDLQAATAPGATGATPAQVENARAYQRRAQFLLDFIEAENSMGFHADQEAMRVLALSLDAARNGQLALRDPRIGPPDNTPDEAVEIRRGDGEPGARATAPAPATPP